MRCKLNGQHRAEFWRNKGSPNLAKGRAIIQIGCMLGVDLIAARKIYTQQQGGLDYQAPVDRGESMKSTRPLIRNQSRPIAGKWSGSASTMLSAFIVTTYPRRSMQRYVVLGSLV